MTALPLTIEQVISHLRKDKLRCKIQLVIQLLRFLNSLSFQVEKHLHCVLKLLAVDGTKQLSSAWPWVQSESVFPIPPRIVCSMYHTTYDYVLLLLLLLCERILRWFFMFIVEPSNFEEYIRLNQNRLPSLEIVLNFHQQVPLWNTQRSFGLAVWQSNYEEAGLQSLIRPLRGTPRKSLLEISTTMALSRLRVSTCPEVSVMSWRWSKCSAVELAQMDAVLLRPGPVRAGNS